MCHRGTSLTVSVRFVRSTIRRIGHVKVIEGMGEVQPERQRLKLLASQVMNLIMKGKISPPSCSRMAEQCPEQVLCFRTVLVRFDCEMGMEIAPKDACVCDSSGEGRAEHAGHNTGQNCALQRVMGANRSLQAWF